VFKIFKKSEKTTLAYDSKLISKFHKDHDDLVAHIMDIQKALNDNKEREAKQFLKQLRMRILGHFMEEDIKLYWYLKKYYSEHHKISQIITMFEKSIKDIQKEVIDFLDYYLQETQKLDMYFKEKFSEIIQTLSSRIQTEESNLYTLYVK
jgi:ubiquinone/menaquinone biosynthesis C-methylase UbiE